MSRPAWILSLLVGIPVAAASWVLPLAAQDTADPTTVESDSCRADIQVWADSLTAQLPLFANLERARLQTAFRVVLVGIPELEPLAPEEQVQLGVDPADQVFRLYFSTLERQITMGSPASEDPNLLSGRRSDQVQLAHRAYVVRRQNTDPWRLFSLELKGPGIPSRDVSEGGMAQAIRRWQQSGCPG